MSHRGERLAECSRSEPQRATVATGNCRREYSDPVTRRACGNGCPGARRDTRPRHWLLVPKSSGEIWSRNSRNFSTSSSCSSGIAIPASSSTPSLP